MILIQNQVRSCGICIWPSPSHYQRGLFAINKSANGLIWDHYPVIWDIKMWLCNNDQEIGDNRFYFAIITREKVNSRKNIYKLHDIFFSRYFSRCDGIHSVNTYHMTGYPLRNFRDILRHLWCMLHGTRYWPGSKPSIAVVNKRTGRPEQVQRFHSPIYPSLGFLSLFFLVSDIF